ncbi:DUF6382 domain-containing protein [Paenibacillus montanisoli]|uniref:FHA domain-containing protein n=1 Tax=Paenibacillus montanisoli TaxID=2081970 RepID=A0A328U2P9_9BACL|nr:DUF6382 domain-containing protein [Paenibacillus montanisoli]RAP77068.1 hypothetical protein DL346_00750 [Paenibacillus montanisoli]
MLEELKVDFTMKRGLEMIVDLASGISRERLDPIETQMLQNQRIPRLLPVEWTDIDGSITFRYPINGKRMLMHRLQTQQLKMVEFYALLLAIVETLDDCRHYMLREDCFLLHEQYIFVGENWEDTGLAYVPLQDTKLVASAGEAVLAMAVRWVGAIAEPDGSGMQQVFQDLRGEYVAWGKLRRTLLGLLGAEYRESNPESTEAGKNQPVSAVRPAWPEIPAVPASLRTATPSSASSAAVAPLSPAPVRAAAASHVSPIAFTSSAAFEGSAAAGSGARDELELPLTELPDQSEGASKRSWMIASGSLLSIAAIWRFLYLPVPSRNNLFLCSGLTLMAAAAALIVNRRLQGSRDQEGNTEWSERRSSSNDGDGFIPDSIPLRSGNRRFADAMRQHEEAAESYAHREIGPINGSSIHAIGGLQRNTFEHAASDDATVLLGQDATQLPDSDPSKQMLPWLERLAEGREAEKVRLEQSRCLIGRASEGVDFVDMSSGISRAHLELSASSDCWFAKDMGSRNGTTLNGTEMVPYKAYSLTDSDILQLAGEQGPKYVFRAGNAKPSKPALRTG